MKTYRIYDRARKVYLKGEMINKKRANNKKERLDLEYGSYNYRVDEFVDGKYNMFCL